MAVWVSLLCVSLPVKCWKHDAGEPTLLCAPNTGPRETHLLTTPLYRLERPCMEHMPFLLARSDNGEDPCGHALMASCPSTLPAPPPSNHGYDLGHPENLPNDFSSFPEHIPFGHGTQMLPPGVVEERMGQQTWDLKKGDLALLLDLSRRLNLEGEITPVMAWGMVLSCPGVERLGLKEVEGIREELRDKIRCYGYVLCLLRRQLSLWMKGTRVQNEVEVCTPSLGYTPCTTSGTTSAIEANIYRFGAVLEEFEVRDALQNAFAGLSIH